MSIFKNVLYFFTAFFGAFLFWSIIKLFLPNIPVTNIHEQKKYEFYNINLSNIFMKQFNKKISNLNLNESLNQSEQLKNMILKAIYNDGKKAFIIIEANKKNIFIDINDSFNGYKLININHDFVVFTKNKQKYILTFKKNIQQNNLNTSSSTIKVKKQLIQKFKKNPALIWNDIGIIKYPYGYKITYIKKDSIFDKIGLKKSDIIIKVNNKYLKNDSQAWQLYNNIDKFDSLSIEIKRNNKKKVLNYEID
ncbi:hypothetical protein NAMH_0008 [Nautilia profundicola AmH]|uniref:General secretion pathway protein C n=1 Tax=Nautilia profundicola (strain ATCC BAA-1463 / DSM 18972 / AmH) TaxID=598659 RepID=B9L742_NAUPA|nr:hypothetical protein [Nautilia profundicola]ACM92267.1 hypothetical protein NAMH_0008 [Nautilia profundicola AmH]